MPWAIFDTGVYIDHWERGLASDVLAALRRTFVVRQSAVVLSELRRGARTSEARRRVETLARQASLVWGPTNQDWWEAGRLIQQIGDRRDWNPHKRRDFQNDALIALTAQRYGAAVVTTNAADFDLLSAELDIHVVPIVRGATG